jgi:60 kDa SS-A/Ro ribonucleoprotein
MSKALRNYGQDRWDVSNQLPGMKANNGGGFTYTISDRDRLTRFLILGVDGGTYYVSEKDLTDQNVEWLEKLISNSPELVLDVVLDVSTNNRAYRNSAAIFVLALMLNHAPDSYKSQVVDAVSKVARTATMVYELAQYIENLGGWGRSKRRAVATWFTSKTPDQLAYQAVKFRQRNGWTLRDLMRLSHPVGIDQRVGNFILGKEPIFGGPSILAGFHEMQRSGTVNEVQLVLSQYPNLPWETIPTQFLKVPEVWKTLFYNDSLNGQALVRNIVRLSRIGAFEDQSFAADYAIKLVDPGMIKKTRLHPMQYLLAGITYDKGQKNRGAGLYSSNIRSKDWKSDPFITSALDEGFKLAFGNVDPVNQPIRIGVDVSSSMGWGLANGSDITAAEGAAAMAVILARSEPYVEIFGFASTIRNLKITDQDSLATVLRKTGDMTFGSTNPSALMKDATHIDHFIVITDNEVNSGKHISREMKSYRDKTGRIGSMTVMGMTATEFTLADPNDNRMLDVVGFDSAAPKVVTDFMKGLI